MPNHAIGIDLGTTFSVTAAVNPLGLPVVLTNIEGDTITPSVVLHNGERLIVGDYAQREVVVQPENTVQLIKRHMGSSDYTIELHGTTYTPQQVSSFILQKLKSDAEDRLGHPVTHAVITVPAHFGDKQRRATIEAGELAGLTVIKLLNEPTAAAFAYGLTADAQRTRTLVFDLGGGTFDVAVVEIEDHNVQVLATRGDSLLGGADWDELLINAVAESFCQAHGHDPRNNLLSYHRLREKCIEAKIQLSTRASTHLFYDDEGKAHRQRFTREQFEAMSQSLMERIETLLEALLEDVGMSTREIDNILLVGGATRMPMVRNRIQSLFGRAPCTDVNPDECVALGSALVAALESARLNGEVSPVPIRTHDVTGHSLGVVTLRDGALLNTPVIPRNTRIPCERLREDLTNSIDGQTSIDIWLVQGEDPDPLRCDVLGHFEFYGIPPRPAGRSRIAVTFRYSINGIVDLFAMDQTTGQSLPHRRADEPLPLQAVAEQKVPAHFALLIDCSGSMFGPDFAAVKRITKSLIKSNIGNANHFSIIGSPGDIVASHTRDFQTLNSAIDELKAVGGSPLHLGIARARNTLGHAVGHRRVLVMLSDGLTDNRDTTSGECRRIRQSGGRVIAMGLTPTADHHYLASLCSNRNDYHRYTENISADENNLLDGAYHNLAAQS